MKKTEARNVPSEAKMQCFKCIKSMKFRELRIHLLKVHKIPNVFLSCTEIVNEKVCEFFCGKTLDCFIEHMKQKKNTHKTSDGAGDIPAKRVSTKVTTHVETEGVEAGGELVHNEKTPVIIKIKTRKVNAEETVSSEVEPPRKRRKVEPVKHTVSTPNVKHKGVGKRSKLMNVDTTNQL